MGRPPAHHAFHTPKTSEFDEATDKNISESTNNWASDNSHATRPLPRDVPRYGPGPRCGERLDDEDWAIVEEKMKEGEVILANTTEGQGNVTITQLQKTNPNAFQEFKIIIVGNSSSTKTWFFSQKAWKVKFMAQNELKKRVKKFHKDSKPAESSRAVAGHQSDDIATPIDPLPVPTLDIAVATTGKGKKSALSTTPSPASSTPSRPPTPITDEESLSSSSRLPATAQCSKSDEEINQQSQNASPQQIPNAPSINGDDTVNLDENNDFIPIQNSPAYSNSGAYVPDLWDPPNPIRSTPDPILDTPSPSPSPSTNPALHQSRSPTTHRRIPSTSSRSNARSTPVHLYPRLEISRTKGTSQSVEKIAADPFAIRTALAEVAQDTTSTGSVSFSSDRLAFIDAAPLPSLALDSRIRNTDEANKTPTLSIQLVSALAMGNQDATQGSPSIASINGDAFEKAQLPSDAQDSSRSPAATRSFSRTLHPFSTRPPSLQLDSVPRYPSTPLRSTPTPSARRALTPATPLRIVEIISTTPPHPPRSTRKKDDFIGTKGKMREADPSTPATHQPSQSSILRSILHPSPPNQQVESSRKGSRTPAPLSEATNHSLVDKVHEHTPASSVRQLPDDDAPLPLLNPDVRSLNDENGSARSTRYFPTPQTPQHPLSTVSSISGGEIVQSQMDNSTFRATNSSQFPFAGAYPPSPALPPTPTHPISPQLLPNTLPPSTPNLPPSTPNLPTPVRAQTPMSRRHTISTPPLISNDDPYEDLSPAYEATIKAPIDADTPNRLKILAESPQAGLSRRSSRSGVTSEVVDQLERFSAVLRIDPQTREQRIASDNALREIREGQRREAERAERIANAPKPNGRVVQGVIDIKNVVVAVYCWDPFNVRYLH